MRTARMAWSLTTSPAGAPASAALPTCTCTCPATGAWPAARLRTEIEAELLQAVPGLYARIELLPLGMQTAMEAAIEAAGQTDTPSPSTDKNPNPEP